MRGRLLLGWAGVIAAAALALALAATLRSGRSPAPPIFWEAPEFRLTAQTGAELSDEALAGTVWVAAFVYTRCPDFCPLVTRRMAELRDALAAGGLLGSRVRLVSFTVDPARDTPEVLREYAAGFGATDPARWAFLTGPVESVRAVIEGGFRLPATPGATAPGSDPARAAGGHPAGHGHAHDAGGADYVILHSDRVVLVDAAGRVRGFYAATDPAERARLDADLRSVLRE